MTNEQIHDITTLPSNESEARKKARKGATAVLITVGALLLIDDQVKRFSKKKQVTVTVKDRSESDEPQS